MSGVDVILQPSSVEKPHGTHGASVVLRAAMMSLRVGIKQADGDKGLAADGTDDISFVLVDGKVVSPDGTRLTESLVAFRAFEGL